MISYDLATIITALQQPAQRAQALAQLAAWAGARAALLFGKDAEIGRFLPAPGLPQTLRDGRAWQRFLDTCAEHQTSCAMLPDPVSSTPALAMGLCDAVGSAILVFLDGRPDAEQTLALQAMAPLLGAILRSERSVQAAEAHAAAACDSSRRANSLNAALDVSRRELQGAYATLERELQWRRDAERTLRDADRRKDEFLAMLAHELRNPLAPISMAAQILRAGPVNAVRQEQTCQIIDRQVNHMKLLLDDLLDVSRVTGGMVSLAREPNDMRVVVADALEQSRPLINARNHHLTLNLGQHPMMVLGDATRLVQIVTNLLNNAAKYTLPGGDIHVQLALRGPEVVVTVRDTGIGIDASLLPHIFDLFIQGERSSDRSQGGLGLGLALVRSLAHRHGGAVKATSRGLGQGSQFQVTLPYVPSAKGATVPPASHGSGEPVSIMIVDDNEDAAQTLALYLQAHGHEVQVAFDGRQALALAASFTPRALLLDIGLPDMDGYALARRLHELPNTEHCLTLALTGYGLPEDRERSRQAGFHHHLTKPVNIAELTQLLAAASMQPVA